MARRWLGGILCALALCLSGSGCASPSRATAELDPTTRASKEEVERQAAMREAAFVAYVEGVYMREQGNLRGALHRFTQAVRLHPEDSGLRLALARQHLEMGALPESKRLLESFVERYDASAAEHLLLARLHVAAGEDDAALVELEHAASKEPDNPDIWSLQGRVFLDLERYEEALVSFQRAEVLRPYQATTSMRLGDCYQGLERPEDAAGAYRRALELDPGLRSAREALARLYRSSGRLEEAIALYRDAYVLEPQDREAVDSLLELYIQEQRYADGVELLRSYQAHATLEPRQQYVLGWMLLQLDRLAEADEVLKPLSEHGVRGIESLLGEVAMRQERIADAEAHFRAAIDQRPDDCGAYVSLATVLMERLRDDSGRLQRQGVAADSLRAVLNAASDMTPAGEMRCNALLGFAYGQLRDFEAAVPHLEASYNLDPANTDILFNLAMAHQELGDFDTALRYGRDVLDLEPENPAALNFVGYILAERGLELQSSETLIRRALEAEPENGYFVDSLGWVFYQMGLYAEAAVELERAVALTERQDPIILEHLGDAYLKMGRLDGAYSAYVQSRELEPDNPELLEKISEIESQLGKP
jgi:tetratricopeptide (TPR) repeat protein